MNICVKLQNGSKIERYLKKSKVTIGRSDSADLVVPDESLSRLHAQIEFIDGKYFVTDLGSSNGVFVDGERIDPKVKVPFATYMTLAIGPLDCLIEDELELNFPPVSEVTKTAVKKAQDKSFQTRPERKTKKNSPGISPDLLLVGGGIVVALAIYLIFSRDKKDGIIGHLNVSSQKVSQSAPELPKRYRPRVLNQNTSSDVYLARNLEKTCVDMFDLCKELQIEDNKIEGFVKDGPELYIYIKPSKLYVHPRLAKLKELPMAEDVLAHYLILGSPIIQLLLKHEYDQIHVVQISNVDQPVKAFRYHITPFESGEIDLSGLIDAMSASIRTKQTMEVGETLQKLFPPIDLGNI